MTLRSLAVLCIPLSLASTGIAAGATSTWTGADPASANWSAADNWSSAPAAAGTDNLLFPAGAARTMNTDDTVSSVGSITVSGDGYQIGGSALTIGGGLLFSAPSAGPLVTAPLTVGASQTFVNNGAAATIGTSATSLSFKASTTLTFDGTGDFLVNAATIGAGPIIKDGAGTVTLAKAPLNGGATVNAGTLSCGQGVSGAIGVAGGARLLFTGTNNTEDGVLTLADGALVQTVGFISINKTITLDGHATLQGTPLPGSELEIEGDGLTDVALIDGPGHVGSISTLGEVAIVGSSTFSGGSHVQSLSTGTNALLLEVNGAAGTGPIQVDDGTTLVVESPLTTLANDIRLGSIPGTFYGATLDVQPSQGPIAITGTLTLENNLCELDGGVTLSAVGGPGSLNISGTAASPVVLNGAGTWAGATFIDDGTLQLGTGTLPATTAVTLIGSGKLDLASHDSTIAALSSNALNSVVTLGSGTLTISGSQNGLFSGSITGSGGALFSGSGTETLLGANSYTGATVVTGTRTLVIFSGSIATSSTAVKSGATLALASAGRVGAVTSTGGTLLVGAVTPRTGTSGNLLLDAASKLGVVVDGAGSSQLTVAGTVSLGGTLDIAVATVPAVGDSFVLIANDGSDVVSGTFAGAPEGAIVTAAGGTTFRVSYVGGDGNDVSLTAVTPGQAVDLGGSAVDAGTVDSGTVDSGTADLASVDLGAVDLSTTDGARSPHGASTSGCACEMAAPGNGRSAVAWALLLGALALRLRRRRSL